LSQRIEVMMRFMYALVALLVSSTAFAQRVIQNDNVGEMINSPVASAEIISGEAYEAVFDIPEAWMPETTGRPLNITGVRVLMVDNPMKSGRACGRFSIEIYEEPAAASTVEPTCELYDINNLQLCFGGTPCPAPLVCSSTSICASTPRHKPPGAQLFDLAAVPVAMGPLGFVIEGSPSQGNATFTDLTIAAINQNQGVNISPIAVTTNKVRVVLKALDEQCGTLGQGAYFPILVSDTNGVSGDSRNFIYGREPNFCPTTRHYVWEDFAPAFNQAPGDWLIRLIVDYNDSTVVPPGDMGGDMGDDMDMGVADMDETSDMGSDMDPDPMDMANNNQTNNDPNNQNNSTNNNPGNGALAITSITPESALNTASTDVLIIGAGFVPGLEVLIGTSRIGVTETRAQRISATIPEGLVPGVYDVIVTNPDDSTAVLQAGFEVLDPASIDRQSGADDGCGCMATRSNLPGTALLILLIAGFLRVRRSF